jgi:adenylate cyclase class 2
MHGPEIELKIAIDDPREFRRRVESGGFILITERTFEHNTLYDTADRSLRARGQLLRLRNYGNRCILTHKRLPPAEPNASSRYKTRIETESIVEDCAAMVEIFTQLGYEAVFRYEKFRTEWHDRGQPGGHIVLDETPIGFWAELEGPPDWIDKVLAQLGLDIERTSTLSYGRLFLDWKARSGSPSDHMTFDSIPEPVSR